MTQDAFDRQLQAALERLESLRGQVRDRAGSSALLDTLWNELTASLETLQLAAEELHQQNDELATTRLEVEAGHANFQQLFDLAPEAYLVTDPQGVIRQANAAAVALLHTSAAFLTGLPLATFIARAEHAELFRQLPRLASAQTTQRWESVLQPHGLPPVPVAVSVAGIRNPSGALTGLRWNFSDTSKATSDAAEIRGLFGASEQSRLTLLSLLEDQQKADEKAQWLASFPERNPNPIVELDLSTGVLHYVNPTARQLFPGLPDEGLRHPLLAALPAMAAQIAEQGTIRREATVGEVCFAQMLHYLPEVRRVRVYCADITERRRMEEALRESEARYGLLFQEMINGFAVHEIICDAAGKPVDYRFLQVNPAFEAFTGLRAQEVTGKTVREVMPWIEPVWIERYGRVALTGEPDQFEEYSGTQEKWFEVRAFCPERGKFAAVFSDVTQRRQAEEALRASEASFRAMAESMPQIVWVTRPDGWNIYFNQQWVDYTGLTFEQSHGHGWNIPFHPDDKQRAWEAWQQATQHNATYSLECRLRRADGAYRWWLVRGVPMRNASGEVLKWFGTCTDIEDIKQAEAVLKAAERAKSELLGRLNEAQQVARIGSWEWDLQTDHVWWSDETYRIFGVTPQDYVPTFEANGRFIHPDDFARYGPAFDQSLQTGNPLDFDFRLIPKDGRLKHCRAAGLPVRDPSGRPIRFIGTVMDITDRKQAEEALSQNAQQSLQRAAALVDLSRETTATHGDVTASLRRITGQVAQTLGIARISIWRCTPACDAIECVDLFEVNSGQHSSGRQLTAQDYPAYFAAMTQSDLIAADDAHTDARTREFAENYLRPLGISSMLDAAIRIHGQPSGVVCHEHTGPARQWTADEKSFAVAIANLVSQVFEAGERAKLEGQLRLEAAALNAAANEVVITDRQGIIQWVNPAFTKITGYTIEEAVGQNPRILQSGKHDREFYHQLWATILRGETWRGEIINRRKDASLFTEEAIITPVKDEQGAITHFVAIKQDITERKLLEAKFFRAQRLEGLGALAGGVAHDLNNVLAPILMASELLRSLSTDAQTNKLLEMIQTNSQRGAGMIRQILAFARGTAGEKIVLQVSHLLKDISKMMKETFPPSIRTELRVASGLSPVLGDSTELYQVLLNLCVNARDAMPKGGTITLGAENIVLDETYARLSHEAKPGHYIVVTVADTGSGIPPEIRDKIFEPFFTTKEPGKGTGLGLATVKDIVTGHGGFIHLYSEVGKGTQFKIYLPIAQGEEAAAEAMSLTLPGGHGELVLLVDDEAAVREIVKATLENYGYRVVTAEDGTEGVARFVEHLKEVQLLLTDIQMPHMDGMALIRALRNIQPSLKVIAASGLNAHEAALKATGIGVQAFIVKPFTATSLLLALDGVLHSGK